MQTGGQNDSFYMLAVLRACLKTFCCFSEEDFTKTTNFFLHFVFELNFSWHVGNKSFFFPPICRRPIIFHAFPTVSHFKLVPYAEETGSCFERPHGTRAGKLSGRSSFHLFLTHQTVLPHHEWSSHQSLLWGRASVIHAGDEHNRGQRRTPSPLFHSSCIELLCSLFV